MIFRSASDFADNDDENPTIRRFHHLSDVVLLWFYMELCTMLSTGMNHGDYEDIQGGAMICAKAPV